ncbi:vacuolar protein sorting-associated protein 8 homolog [Lampetra planeri]
MSSAESSPSRCASMADLTDDIEELDDKEFDLPQVDTPPTLESILNEDDEEENPFQLDDPALFLADGSDACSVETSSLASTDSGDRPDSRKKKKAEQKKPFHGSVLKHVILKGVSSQIVSAADRVEAGLPTAMAVSNVIAVGTAHGLVLVYDPNQALRLCLGSTAIGAQYGAVSALGINRDCTRLLCGFAKGQITMWDLTNGKLLRTITDAHPPGTAVLHIKFTDDPTLAICNDSGGSVFELAFKRVMGVRTCESRCLFSGAKGEVCCIQPLWFPTNLKEHPMSQHFLLAMASLTKILIVGLKPSLKVMLSVSYGKTNPASVPLMAWHFTLVNGSADPVLAFCRGSVVHFILASCRDSDNIHFSKQRELHLNYEPINLTWMNSRVLALLDDTETLHVVERANQEQLEALDIASLQLVYNSSHFKSLATGGNVSQALALVGEKACYQSICSFGGQVLYLGIKSVHVMSLRTWRERVDLLVRQERFPDALNLAWSFHQGSAKAVLGLPVNIAKRKSLVADKMTDILMQYVMISMKKCPEPGKTQALEKHFQEVVPMCIEYCLLLGRTDLLFTQMYEQLGESSVARGVFLESLEPHVLGDRLTSITPQAMRDLILHYQGQARMATVEACILHMDITSLDLQQVINLCWSHGLYDAVIYIYNTGMNDYVTPIKEILKVLQTALSTGRQLPGDKVTAGNKLLVYLSCCLVGRAYPMGDIPKNLAPTVKKQVFEFVIKLHSDEAEVQEEVYPCVRTLLHFDTREFLNVLTLTFEDFRNDKQVVEYQQRIVDVLLQVMVEGKGFSPSQVGSLFTFLARQLAKPENTLFVNRHLFDQVLEFLCGADDDSRHAERQQALLELLQAGGTVHFDESKLLALAEKAKFYLVCEFMFEKKQMYDQIVMCYLKDEARREDVFNFVHNILSIPGYSEQEKALVHQKVMANIQELVSISPQKTADLVISDLSESLIGILALLEGHPRLLFGFLQCILETGETSPLSRDALSASSDVNERYIDLLCQFSPEKVLPFLRTSEQYRIDQAIKLVEEHGVSSALAYLLEKSNDVQRAFSIMLQILKEKLDVLMQSLGTASNQKGVDQRLLEGVQTALEDVTQLCQRNSGHLGAEEREGLWFPLLEVMMSPQREIKKMTSSVIAEELKNLTKQLLNSMTGFLTLPAILQRIIQDPIYGSGRFGEIKELVLGMLDTFSYEQTLLETTTGLLNQDLHWSLSQLRKAVCRGLHPRQDACGVCTQHYGRRQSPGQRIIIFGCGHVYHEDCLRGTGCHNAGEGQSNWSCYLCNASNRDGGVIANQAHARTTSLAQIRVASAKEEKKATTKGSKKVPEVVMDPEQFKCFDELQKINKGRSRIAILAELSKSHSDSEGASYRPLSMVSSPVGHESVFQNEHFQLRLDAPPPKD